MEQENVTWAGPQEGSEKQRKMAEDAAVVLRGMTEAAGGRLRSQCMAVGSWASLGGP